MPPRPKTSKTRRKSTSRKKAPPDPVLQYVNDVLAGKIIAGPHVRNSCRRHLDDLKHGGERGLTWDLEAAVRAIDFFPDVLRLAQGKFEGMPFNLEPSQKFIIGSIFGWKRADGARRFRRVYIEEGKGNGKALALDTPIPTPRGWTTMERLKVGDSVFDENGAPCRVTGATEVMLGRPCYRVEFSDGETIVADAEHLWLTSSLRSGGKKGPKSKDAPRKRRAALRTTAQIAATLRVPPSSSTHPQAKWNHRVDVSGALQLPAADLPIPPYTLGAWLGDGDSDCGRLTNAFADGKILEEIRKEGVRVSIQAGASNTTGRFGLLGISGALRAMDLLGKKHIPDVYLRASQEQRLALLAGLMDTDGFVSASGQAELTFCLERLARDASELIRTLGFKATVSESDAVFHGRSVGRRWRIQFWPREGDRVFRLPRKAARLRPAPRTRALSRGRMIVGCAQVHSVPVRCISVDSPSRMYLAGTHFVPTHNSPKAAGIGMYCLLADGEAQAEVYAGASMKSQAMVIFRAAVMMWRQSPALSTRLVPSGGNPIWQLSDLKRGGFFRPISTEEAHSGPMPSCALLDEIHEHRDSNMVEMLERGFKSRRQPLLVMITNSGSDRQSVCWQEHLWAVRVAAGTMVPDDEHTYVGDVLDGGDATFSYVCALDKGDDPLEDESCWIKANPLLGITMPMEEVRAAVAQARAIPGKLNNILRLHFCVWTESDTAWMGRKTLELVLADFDPSIHAGSPVYIGLDLSGSQDLTAAAFVVETGTKEVERDGKPVALPTYDAWVEVWTPADTMAERALRDQAPYEEWVRAGWLHAIPGKIIRLGFIAARLAEISTEYQVRLLAYDRYSYRKLEEEMAEMGLTLPQAEHPQGGVRRAKPTPDQIEEAKLRGEEAPLGLWMPGSVLSLEELILEERIRLLNSPVLIWACMSAAMETDAFNNRWFSKRRAVNRIDPLVALAMGAGAATSQASKTSQSGPSYEGRGLLFL